MFLLKKFESLLTYKITFFDAKHCLHFKLHVGLNDLWFICGADNLLNSFSFTLLYPNHYLFTYVSYDEPLHRIKMYLDYCTIYIYFKKLNILKYKYK